MSGRVLILVSISNVSRLVLESGLSIGGRSCVEVSFDFSFIQAFTISAALHYMEGIRTLSFLSTVCASLTNKLSVCAVVQ